MASAPTETVEAMRRRAIHRLIGAAVLVVAGVIGFPLLFDNQPRPIPVDLPIVIPDKAKVAPLAAPPAVQAAAAASAAAPGPATAPAVAQPPAPVPAPVVTAPVKPETKAETKAEGKVEPKPAPKVEAKAEAKSEVKADAKADDARKAKALLEGKEPAADTAVKPADAAAGRFVVQVGAFADAAKVREVRQKVESAGLKTYTQVVETKEGSRTRVRVGPFADKAEAGRAADKIRKLDLPVAILVL